VTPALRTVLLSGGWTPYQLGTQLVGWWDASYGVAESGGLVSAWADRIGGYTAAQATGTAKPAWSATSLNGTPGLTFDGSDDLLAMVGVPAIFPDGAEAGWIFGLADQQAAAPDANSRDIIGYGATNAGRMVSKIDDSGTNRAAVRAGTGAAVAQRFDTTIAFNGVGTLFGQFEAAQIGGRIDGVAFGPGAAVIPATATTRLRIGAAPNTTAGAFWQGVIGHGMVGTGVLSPTDVQRLEAWALWLCGKQALLPADNPYRYRRP